MQVRICLIALLYAEDFSSVLQNLEITLQIRLSIKLYNNQKLLVNLAEHDSQNNTFLTKHFICFMKCDRSIKTFKHKKKIYKTIKTNSSDHATIQLTKSIFSDEFFFVVQNLDQTRELGKKNLIIIGWLQLKYCWFVFLFFYNQNEL
jgi:hypothetical protein